MRSPVCVVSAKPRNHACQWYPEKDYRVLLLTLGELVADRVPGNVWEFFGEVGAKAQFSNVYTSVVRAGDPVSTLKRAPTTWSLYHDTGRIQVELDDSACTARIKLLGYPIACPRVCASTTGYLRQLLVGSGARAVEVQMVSCPPPRDVPVVWEAGWQPPEARAEGSETP